jgi:hypothetical protein
MFEIDNETRAGWAQEAVERFQARTRTDDDDAVADLLCNLMHLCNQSPDIYGPFAAALRRAEFNFEAELDEASIEAGELES